MKYIIILLLIIFVLINFVNEKFDDNVKIENNIDELDLTIVRIRVHKLDYDWVEPFNKKSSYESIGTGFFINKEGFILTNFHVINNGIKVYIQIPIHGKKTYICDIISVYPKLDIALLKVNNYKTNHYLNLGDSDNINKGDISYAVGYPLGQNKIKITSGIVSGIQDGDIQTDSPINKGNSGGPLLDENNKVIGINYSGHSEAQNIGYAIPINYVKLVLKDMYKNKIINFPILGVIFNNSNHLLFQLNKLCNEGYYVADVLEKGTFDLGNIKKGDIICSFDDKKIDNYGEILIESLNTKFHISKYLKYKKVGDEINVILIRDFNNNNFQDKNTIKIVKTKIKLLPNTYYKIRHMHFQYEKIDYQILGGMIFMNLSNNHLNHFENNKMDNLNKYEDLKYKIKEKIILTNILKGSKLAEDSIFNPPLIIKKVNNIEVNNLEQLRVALKKHLVNDTIKYLSFLTENNKYFLISLDECKKEEKFLSKQYNYKITNYTKELLNLH